MTYGWTNEAGEPIMDGAAWRFEQELDAQSAHERSSDYDGYGYDEPDELTREDCIAQGLHGRDSDGLNDGTWVCIWCYTPCPTPPGCGDSEEDDLDARIEEAIGQPKPWFLKRS